MRPSRRVGWCAPRAAPRLRRHRHPPLPPPRPAAPLAATPRRRAGPFAPIAGLRLPHPKHDRRPHARGPTDPRRFFQPTPDPPACAGGTRVPFAANSSRREELLAAIGVGSAEDLFSDIPKAFRTTIKGVPNGLGEGE